jgi:AraC-like DNA-binding protein
MLQLPLSEAPQIAVVGIGRHGQTPHETFLIPDGWCLHLYRDPMRLRVAGEWFDIVPGSATLIPPGAPIEFHFARPTTHLHVFAHFVARGDTRTFAPFQLVGADFESCFAQMQNAVGFWAQRSPRARALLWDVLWRLSLSPDEQENEFDALVARARETIELRLGEPLSVAMLAQELGVSHNHLTRRFRLATGQTVVDYIRARRSLRAKYLLEHTTLPIKAIAAQVGLGDFHTFNKAMRRALGAAPRSFRSTKKSSIARR